MKLTESMLRKIIREEVARLNETISALLPRQEWKKKRLGIGMGEWYPEHWYASEAMDDGATQYVISGGQRYSIVPNHLAGEVPAGELWHYLGQEPDEYKSPGPHPLKDLMPASENDDDEEYEGRGSLGGRGPLGKPHPADYWSSGPRLARRR